MTTTIRLFRSFYRRVFFTVPQQDMQLYIQTAFVCPLAPVRFASSSPLVLLKSNVKTALWKLRKCPS